MAKSKYNKEKIIEALCEWVSEGKTLRAFCRLDGNPPSSLLYGWINSNPKWVEQFAHARDIGFDEIANECFDIADEMPERDDEGRLDKGFVSWQKLRIHTRQQLLSKWSPKKYGDKVAVEHSVDNNLAEIIKARRKKALGVIGGRESSPDSE